MCYRSEVPGELVGYRPEVPEELVGYRPVELEELVVGNLHLQYHQFLPLNRLRPHPIVSSPLRRRCLHLHLGLLYRLHQPVN